MEVSIARIDFSFLLATSKQLTETQEGAGRRSEGCPREALAGRGSGSRSRPRRPGPVCLRALDPCSQGPSLPPLPPSGPPQVRAGAPAGDARGAATSPFIHERV